MIKRFILLLTVLLLGVLVLAACGGDEEPTPAPTEAPVAEPEPTATPAEVEEEEAPAEPTDDTVQVGMVSDLGGIDDKSFNQTAWRGIELAQEDFGIDGVFLESQQQTDYEKNINEFLSQNKDLIVTVGFLLGDATRQAAEANSDAQFTIVDFPSEAPNIRGLLFNVAEPSFLAGYLASGMSETGVVCTYGGLNIPPVVDFMVAFQKGVEYYNAEKGSDVTLLGWDNAAQDGAFTGNFESTDDGRRLAENLFDEGCDVIFPVAGPVGLGSAAAAQDRELMMIGVDSDQYDLAPEFSDVFVSSVLKNMDIAVYDTIQTVVEGNFEGGDNFFGNLENGGVGLASYHDFEDKVPDELKAEIEAIIQGIIAGDIDISGAAVEAAAPAEPDRTYTIGMVSDLGGIDDKSFNQTAWRGIELAQEDFGIDGVFLESQQQTDYEKNINEFLSQNKDLIVTVGFLLGDATRQAAEANSDAQFTIVDFPSEAPNIRGLLFNVAEPSFLAGYLASGMSETGVVCTYGGLNIPPVVDFMVAFQKGVEYYNAEKGSDVTLLGWDNAAQDGAFTGNFESTDDGRRLAENLFDEGCDVIFPVAGPVGLGSAAAAQDRELMMIGVDSDQYDLAPEFSDVFVSSVLKNMDIAVYDTIQTVVEGNFEGGDNFFGNLENGGVGLASYHDFEDKVPDELKAEIEAIIQGIIAGDIQVN